MSDFEKQSESDREWLAFRYIASELAGEELASFEAELETSQGAREAVARAVELSQTIAMAQSPEVALAGGTSPHRGKSWPYGIGAGVVAASIAGAIWWNMPGTKIGTSELVENWVKARSVEIQPVDESPELGPVLDAAEPDIAPSWMTAGVISLSGGKVPDDHDGDGKPDESWDDEVMEN